MQQKNLIDNQWIAGDGAELASINPATDITTWRGRCASSVQVDSAVAAARQAFGAWRAISLDQRIAAVLSYRDCLAENRERMIDVISTETGKPRWESATEVDAMIGKVQLSIDAYHERCKPIERAIQNGVAITRFQPHGVCAVLGPFNLPGHLPNGHIVPALIAGDTVVLKPSEQTPAVGEVMIDIWRQSGLPAGVINLVQGERETGEALVSHREVDGIFFTGGCGGGAAIRKAVLEQPQKIVALEMGGNNPLVVHGVRNIAAAALIVVQSAYLTTGQRCTCARRLILSDNTIAEPLLEKVVQLMKQMRIGPPTPTDEPFMGPLISQQAAEQFLLKQEHLLSRDAQVIVKAHRIGDGGAFVAPGLIDVTNMSQREDGELFGPLLQVIHVPDFDAAITEANNTRYGLAAALLCDDRTLFERFVREVRAGVINWNRPTNGASGAMPFGGVGISGNHRPAGYWSADYCSYPVASIEDAKLQLPEKMPIGLYA